jgi:hypothetical protein
MSANCAGFAACNEPKDPGILVIPTDIGITPSATSEAMAASFSEPLTVAISEFLDKMAGSDEFLPVCMTVNGVEEFKAMLPSHIELPEIDFENYTLVVGRYCTSGGKILEKRGVDTESDPMKLNMVFKDTGKGLTAMFTNYFWDFYPKLPPKSIAWQEYTYKTYKEE